MKKVCITIIGVLLIAASATANASVERNNFDGVDLKQEKSGKIIVTSSENIKQIRCFNNDGKKITFTVDENKKEIKIDDKLDKGVWYFQIKTESGETAIKKLEVS